MITKIDVYLYYGYVIMSVNNSADNDSDAIKVS